jgi:Regulator of chromosome condensation (RCC1) repeat
MSDPGDGHDPEPHPHRWPGDYVFDSGWNDDTIVQIAAGDHHTVARRSDGSVVGSGTASI